MGDAPCIMQTMVRRALGSSLDERPRYIEPYSPVVFPESAEVSESLLNFVLRIILFQLLADHLGTEVTVGSDQLVYFDADNPKKCLAPDVYARLAPCAEPIRSWKTWERGAPEVAVEIISDDDRKPSVWARKLKRYRQLGVSELVRFDPEGTTGSRLRIWDRVDGALVERAVQGDRAASLVLNLHWVVAPADGRQLALRVAVDVGGPNEKLIPTRTEARDAEAEGRRAEREAAEARIRELEAELARRPPASS